MKLTVVAASGGIGRQVLTQAVAAGHDVAAVVRDPAKLPDVPARTIVANLAAPDPAALRAAMEGADAVLSGLGARSTAEAGVAWRGTRAIVTAMREAGARRIVVVSAAPIGTVASPGRPNPPRHDPGDGFLLRSVAMPLLKRALRQHYADLARMENELRDSGLDWTVIRPPRLTNGALTASYRTAVGRNVRRGLTVSRADVAHLMLRVVDQPETIGQTIGVAR